MFQWQFIDVLRGGSAFEATMRSMHRATVSLTITTIDKYNPRIYIFDRLFAIRMSARKKVAWVAVVLAVGHTTLASTLAHDAPGQIARGTSRIDRAYQIHTNATRGCDVGMYVPGVNRGGTAVRARPGESQENDWLCRVIEFRISLLLVAQVVSQTPVEAASRKRVLRLCVVCGARHHFFCPSKGTGPSAQ